MNKEISLNDFLSFFPEVELPVIFNDENLLEFSKNNTALSPDAIDQWIRKWEHNIDELTEFVPCIKIPDTAEFTGIVYWKGELLKYEFILVTIDNNGQLVNRKPIASVIADDKTIKKSIATIDPDWIIHIIAGETAQSETNYDSSKSRAFAMEILSDGKIIFNLDD